MSEEQDAAHWFDHYRVADIVRVGDPDKRLYRQFGLEQGTLPELIHPRVWWPWIKTAILGGYGAGFGGPNWRQLTGVFIVHRGHILASLRHRNSAAHPDYVSLVHGLKLGATIRA